MNDAKPADPKADSTPDPTPGRITLYALTADDAAARNNNHQEGDLVPLLVVGASDRDVTGTVFLTGGDTLGVVAAEGDEPGTWHYPPRA